MKKRSNWRGKYTGVRNKGVKYDYRTNVRHGFKFARYGDVDTTKVRKKRNFVYKESYRRDTDFARNVVRRFLPSGFIPNPLRLILPARKRRIRCPEVEQADKARRHEFFRAKHRGATSSRPEKNRQHKRTC